MFACSHPTLHVPAFAGLSCDQCGRSFHFSRELRWAHITLAYVLVMYIYICTEIWHQAAGDTSIRAWTSWHNQQAFENLEIDYCNVCVQARISWPVFPLVSCRFLHESPPFSRLKIPTDKAKTPKKQKSCDIEVSMHRPKAVLPWLQHRLFAWKTVAIAIEVRDGLGSRDSGRWSWRK